jgi:malonyl-CoA O-methyltransferase
MSKLATQSLDKSRIAQSFSRAANKYDSVAQLQRNIGDELLTKLKQDSKASIQQALDLGTGTGHFLHPLQQHSIEPVIGLDLAQGMLAFCQKNQPKQRYLCCDAENMALADNSIDLIFSSLALQWCFQLEQLFSEIKRIAKPGAHIHIATLLPGTLNELKQAWASVDNQPHINEFLSFETWKSAVEKNQFSNITLERKTFQMFYQQPIELLKELRTLGAHNINAKPVSKSKLNQMLSYYQQNARHENSTNVVASYEVLFLTLKV